MIKITLKRLCVPNQCLELFEATTVTGTAKTGHMCM